LPFGWPVTGNNQSSQALWLVRENLFTKLCAKKSNISATVSFFPLFIDYLYYFASEGISQVFAAHIKRSNFNSIFWFRFFTMTFGSRELSSVLLVFATLWVFICQKLQSERGGRGEAELFAP